MPVWLAKKKLPSIVLCKAENNTHKGSARNIDGIHIKEVLDECKDSLVAYGGHAGAAGLTVEEDKTKALKNTE